MPLLFTRFSAAALAFVFTFSSLQFSAENLLEGSSLKITQASARGNAEKNGGGGVGGVGTNDNQNKFSTLGKAQAALSIQDMRGYQSLYEMQVELFAECVAKLKSWDGTLTKPADGWPDGAETDLDKICAEEFIEMNEQGPQRLLLHDASAEQPATGQSENWWGDVLGYWLGKEGGLLPELKQTYTETLRSITAPVADSANADLKKALENWYGAANSLGGSEFLWHYLVTKNQLHAVPFQQGIVTISNCPNLSSPIFANQDCVKTEWDDRIKFRNEQRDKLIKKD